MGNTNQILISIAKDYGNQKADGTTALIVGNKQVILTNTPLDGSDPSSVSITMDGLNALIKMIMANVISAQKQLGITETLANNLQTILFDATQIVQQTPVPSFSQIAPGKGLNQQIQP